MDYEAFAIEVVSTRKAQGLDQEQLAALAGLSVRTIRNVEAGNKVSPATVRLVLRALGIPSAAPEWPPDVDTFLKMVGYRLTALDNSERLEMIYGITRMLVGR